MKFLISFSVFLTALLEYIFGQTQYPDGGFNVSKQAQDDGSFVGISPPSRQLMACLFIERGSPDLLYNYDKSAGAIDMALEHANERLLNPSGYELVTIYRDLGFKCSPRNHVVTIAEALKQLHVRCNVYIGVGKRVYSGI